MQFESAEETRQLNTYELRKMARAKQEAQQLLDRRHAYFQSLYDDIQIPHITIDPMDMAGVSTATDRQAIDIMDAKDAYDRRILKLQEQYRSWQVYLQDFTESDAEILIRYFEQGDPIPRATIDRLIHRACIIHDSYQEANGKARDHEAYTEYQEKLKATRIERYAPTALVLQNGRLVEA